MATVELKKRTGPIPFSEKNAKRRDYFREYKRKELENDPEKVRERANNYHNDVLKQREDHMEKKRANEKRYSQNLKDKIFLILGDKCKSCGFSDKRALQIDHINGGGNQERKGKSQGVQYRLILTKLESGNSDYQILCANCNWIKKRYEK